MKILTLILITAAALAAEQPAKTTAPAQPAVKQTRKTPVAIEIPKDAVQTQPGFFKWTDQDGKVWMYRRTPFGVSRRPWAAAYDKHEVVDEQITAVEQGDSIRFERSSPFGKRAWVRKKGELTENEQAIWAGQQKKHTGSQTAEKE